MAKKIKYFLEYKLAAKFNVHIDPEGHTKLIDDLKRNEVCLSLNYTLGDGSYSVGAYPDSIEGGLLTFKILSNTILEVSINGSFFQSLDPKWEQSLIDDWKSMTELKAYSNQVYDSEPTSHYINGSDAEYEIGTVCLVEK